MVKEDVKHAATTNRGLLIRLACYQLYNIESSEIHTRD